MSHCGLGDHSKSCPDGDKQAWTQVLTTQTVTDINGKQMLEISGSSTLKAENRDPDEKYK